LPFRHRNRTCSRDQHPGAIDPEQAAAIVRCGKNPLTPAERINDIEVDVLIRGDAMIKDGDVLFGRVRRRDDARAALP
jgi:hypothetical protein